MTARFARPALLGGAAAAGVEFVHLAPSVTRLGVVRRSFARRLAGHGSERHVALTFDDGPDPRSTPQFLDVLDALQVRATFFLLAGMLDGAPELGRELVAQGHEVAVHGWHHRRPWLPHPGRDLRELRRATEMVEAVCGERPQWFRPPYGILTRGLLTAARQVELRPVLWTAMGRDWTARASPDSVYARLRPDLRGGATLLLHDSDCTSAPGAWRAALGALPLVVERCRQLGLAVGPLREHGL